MAIDKDDSKVEQSVAGPLDPEAVLDRQHERFSKKDDALGGTRDAVMLSLHAEVVKNLEAQKPDLEKTYKNSEVTESRTFSKQEILEMFVLSAVSKNLDLNTLKVTEVTQDEKGTLLVLEVRAPNADGTYQLFTFKIKGMLEGRNSLVTNIDLSSFDADDMPESGDTLADFRDAKWHTLL